MSANVLLEHSFYLLSSEVPSATCHQWLRLLIKPSKMRNSQHLMFTDGLTSQALLSPPFLWERKLKLAQLTQDQVSLERHPQVSDSAVYPAGPHSQPSTELDTLHAMARAQIRSQSRTFPRPPSSVHLFYKSCHPLHTVRHLLSSKFKWILTLSINELLLGQDRSVFFLNSGPRPHSQCHPWALVMSISQETTTRGQN